MRSVLNKIGCRWICHLACVLSGSNMIERIWIRGISWDLANAESHWGRSMCQTMTVKAGSMVSSLTLRTGLLGWFPARVVGHGCHGHGGRNFWVAVKLDVKCMEMHNESWRYMKIMKLVKVKRLPQMWWATGPQDPDDGGWFPVSQLRWADQMPRTKIGPIRYCTVQPWIVFWGGKVLGTFSQNHEILRYPWNFEEFPDFTQKFHGLWRMAQVDAVEFMEEVSLQLSLEVFFVISAGWLLPTPTGCRGPWVTRRIFSLQQITAVFSIFSWTNVGCEG